MKKHSGFIKVLSTISAVLAILILAGSCKKDADSLWWSNIQVVVLNDPVTITEENFGNYSDMNGPIPIGKIHCRQFILKNKFYEDKRSTVKFSDSELNSYIEYLKKCGLTFTGGNEKFYSDYDCTKPVTSDTKIKPRTDINISGDPKNAPNDFVIYTRVNEAIDSMPMLGEENKSIYTEVYIIDPEKNQYNQTIRTLLPTQTTDTDIKNYIFKNQPLTGKAKGKADKSIEVASWSGITYFKGYLSQIMSSPSTAALEALDDIKTYQSGDNLQGCTLYILLEKTFPKYGIKDNYYTYPTSTITYADAADQKIIIQGQKIPYDVSQTKKELANIFVKTYKHEITVDNIVSIKVSGKVWDETTTLKGENPTVKLTIRFDDYDDLKDKIQ